ncbi:MAG: DinB family protein [Chloroflexi bacterium]|nr:DinB family protein [Chloroflexota bacterium]
MNHTAVRSWQFDALRKTPGIVEHMLRAAKPSDLNTRRDGGNGWTALEVVGHLHDFDGVYHNRARLTLEEDYPDLPFPDPDAMVTENGYNEQALDSVMTLWRERRTAYLDYLTGITDDDWMRTARHPRRGAMTLHEQFVLVLWHDTNHIDQIVKILGDG